MNPARDFPGGPYTPQGVLHDLAERSFHLTGSHDPYPGPGAGKPGEYLLRRPELLALFKDLKSSDVAGVRWPPWR